MMILASCDGKEKGQFASEVSLNESLGVRERVEDH